MQIHKMTLDHYEQLFDLWVKSEGTGLRSLDDSKEGIESFLKRNPETCFLSLDGETVTGAILCGHDGRRGYIYHTVVRSDYRNQGIGTALVRAAVSALQKEGITRVCLNVIKSNVDGKRFWEKHGWKKKDFLIFYSKSITGKENLPLFKIEQ